MLLEKARARKTEGILLSQQLVAEISVVSNILKVVDVDAHHHVHRSAASNRDKTRNFRKPFVRNLGSFLKF